MIDTTPATAATPIRLGCVSYLNTLPLIEGLGKLRDARLTLTAPSRLIDLLLEDEVDLALTSLIDYQRSSEELGLLSVGFIGCDGPTMTVRLLSSRPIQEITEIHADVDSHTSITLARVLVNRASGAVPSIVPFDADASRAERERAEREGRPAPWPETLLIIGDKVMTDSPPEARYPHRYDLGELWAEATGLPFVYAAWMCRVDRAEDPRVWSAAAALDRQRRHNATRLGWITTRHAPVRGWPLEPARTYLGDLLRFDDDPRAREAIDRFFDEARDAGLIETRRPTRWLEAPA